MRYFEQRLGLGAGKRARPFAKAITGIQLSQARSSEDGRRSKDQRETRRPSQLPRLVRKRSVRCVPPRPVRRKLKTVQKQKTPFDLRTRRLHRAPCLGIRPCQHGRQSPTPKRLPPPEISCRPRLLSSCFRRRGSYQSKLQSLDHKI